MRAMKDSGIEWIKQIPSHWNVLRGKSILKLMKRSPEGFNEVITCFRDGEVTLRSKRREDGFTFSDKEIGYQGILTGDLVIHGMDGFAGAIGISDSDGKGSPVLVVCRSKENHTFLKYYLRMLATQNVFIALATGIRERSCDLRWNKIADLLFPVPPREEQQRIASYLDSKCSKIDNIIAKQQQLIEKLKEYKQAVITETVTKGLNPDVPMKDSGIEWIGEIPTDWDTAKFKYLGRFVNGYAFPSNAFVSEGVKVMKIANIQPMKVTWEEIAYVDKTYYDKLPEYIVEAGNLVFALTRPIINGGIKVAIFNDNNDKVLLNQRNAMFKGLSRVKPRWLYYVMQHSLYIQEFTKYIDGTGQQPNISTNEIANIPIPLPNLEVQSSVIEYLDSELDIIDNSISRRQQLITKLQEYKKSLIYEVVTGKREVPNG